MEANDLDETILGELNGVSGAGDMDGLVSLFLPETEDTDGIPIPFLNYFERTKSRTALYEELFLKDLNDLSALCHIVPMEQQQLPSTDDGELTVHNQTVLCSEGNNIFLLSEHTNGESLQSESVHLHRESGAESMREDSGGDVKVSPFPEKRSDPCDIQVTEEESQEGVEFKAHRERRRYREMEEQRRLREEEFQMELRRLIEHEKCQKTSLELKEKMAQEKLEEELLLQKELMSQLRRQVEEETKKVEEDQKRVLQEKQKRKEEEEWTLRKEDQKSHIEEERKLEEDETQNRERDELKKKEEMLRREDQRKKKQEENEKRMREEEQRRIVEEKEKMQMLEDERIRRERIERKKLEDERMKQQEEWKEMEELEQIRSERESENLESKKVEDDRRIGDCKERIKEENENKISEIKELKKEEAEKKELMSQLRKQVKVETKKVGQDQNMVLQEKQKMEEEKKLKKDDQRSHREEEERRQEEDEKQNGVRDQLEKKDEMLRREDEGKEKHPDKRKMREEEQRKKTEEIEKIKKEERLQREATERKKKQEENEKRMREEEQRKIVEEKEKMQMLEDERIRREETERKKLEDERRMKKQEERKKMGELEQRRKGGQSMKESEKVEENKISEEEELKKEEAEKKDVDDEMRIRKEGQRNKDDEEGNKVKEDQNKKRWLGNKHGEYVRQMEDMKERDVQKSREQEVKTKPECEIIRTTRVREEKENTASQDHILTREVCDKQKETEKVKRTNKDLPIHMEKNIEKERDDLEIKHTLRSIIIKIDEEPRRESVAVELIEQEEKINQSENQKSEHSQVGAINEKERTGESISLIEVKRQMEKMEEKNIIEVKRQMEKMEEKNIIEVKRQMEKMEEKNRKEDKIMKIGLMKEMELMKENGAVEIKSKKEGKVDGMRRANEEGKDEQWITRQEEKGFKSEEDVGEQKRMFGQIEKVKELKEERQAMNKRISKMLKKEDGSTDSEVWNDKNKNGCHMVKNMKHAGEGREELMQQEGITLRNDNRWLMSENSDDKKSDDMVREREESTTFERDGGMRLLRKENVLEGEIQRSTPVTPERESEENTGQRSSMLSISPSRSESLLQQDMSTSPGLALSEHTAQKRLSWMKECVSWSKLSVQNRRKQRGSSKKEHRRPPGAATLPPICPDNLLRSSGFKSLQEVTVVSLESLPACSLLTLRQCPQLQSLTIRHCQLKSLEGLNELSKLCVIDAQENNISYVDCHNMSRLKVLRLNHNNLTSIHGLSGAENLVVLELSHNSITRIAGLESMRKLQILTLDHNQLISTRGLRDVYTLQHLSCSHNHLARVEGLENSALLNRLDLTANSLSEPPSLHNHVLLRELRLDDNSISSLQDLADCWLPMLQVLTVAQNRITHLPSMSDFLSLSNLDLRSNCLSEVKKVCDSLTGCRLLGEVYLEGNPLEQESSWRSILNAVFSGLVATDDRKTDSSLYPTSEQRLASASGSFLWFCQTLLQQTRELQHQHNQELGDALPPLSAAEIFCRHLTETRQLAEDQRFAQEYGDLTFTVKNKAVVRATSEGTLDKNNACTRQVMKESVVDLPGGASPEILCTRNIPSNNFENPSQERQYDTLTQTDMTFSKALTDGPDLLSTTEGMTTALLKTAPKHQDPDVKNEAAVVGQQKCRKHSESGAWCQAQNGGSEGKPDLVILQSVQDHAAMVIQACWRGFSLRRRLASALAAVKGTDPGEEDTFELVDVNQFVFDEATLDQDWTLTIPECLPIQSYHAAEPPSSQMLAPLVEASQCVPPSPPVWRPKQAWATEEPAESPKSLNCCKSPSSKSVHSGLSERSEKIVEEWGFTNSSTALLMLKRAQRMKSKRPQQRKDPSLHLGTFRKCTHQLGPIVARNMPTPHNRNGLRDGEAKFGVQHTEKETKQERALEWLQTPDNDHFLPELSLDILNGGRVQLMAEPGYTEQVHLNSGPNFKSTSKHKQNNFPPKSTLCNLRKDTPPPRRASSAPKKERLSFRDNPAQMSVGWGSGKKTHK